MGNFEDVRTAEKRMNEAKAELQRYIDRPADAPLTMNCITSSCKNYEQRRRICEAGRSFHTMN